MIPSAIDTLMSASARFARSALALTRVKQVNVEGWAERFREAQLKRKRSQSEE